jgi:hypothetical protein
MRKITILKINLSEIPRLFKAAYATATKTMRFAFFAVVFIAFGLVGCENELDVYSIDAPSDLQDQIDSIAAAKAAIDTGDTTFIDIATAIVGAEDYSSGWWGAFSDYFAVPTGKLLRLEFINHNGGSENNWNNWNIALTSPAERDTDEYSEYFLLRSDAFGWGNEDFALGLVSNNYPDTDGDEDIWNDFRVTMDGAYVTIIVDHSITGYVFVTATAVGTNGTELEMTYNQPVSATEDIWAFLVTDASYFEMKEAYLLPSEVTVVEDVAPVSIAITGAPEFVEIGDENFWGDAVATVTFADGSTAEADSADIAFTVVPDMTTLGEKTVIVAYSKTKQGAYGQPVSAFYNLEVTNSVASLEVTTLPDITTYYFFNSDSITFNKTGLEITATYSDGTSGVLANSSLEFDSVAAEEGAQNVEVRYVGATSTVTTSCPVTLIKGIGQVGATNLTTGFWGAHSADSTVVSGDSATFKMYCYSTNGANWNSPVTILRKADLTEYAVVRMDNFGWGDGYAAATTTNDWDFDAMAGNINGSYIEIRVKNNGDGTADVYYDVTYANGEKHFQDYAGLAADSADLTTALTVDGCYLVLVN